MDLPNKEYKVVGIEIASFLSVLRISLGDFDFHPTQYLTHNEAYLYCVVWIFAVGMTSIIFLNFVIAEASNSYQSVVDRLKAESGKSRARLVTEGEIVVPFRFKYDSMFPKYIVIKTPEF